MCGINGIYKLSSNQVNLKDEITKMNSQLAHRGPDDNGFWIDDSNRLALGQTRLSILDLSSAGHQPMHDNIGKNTIIFNGEVYNFKLLNKKFLNNEVFNSHSDTETLLKLYRKFGLDMLQHLNGMFAFAIWDASKEELILARDRSGKKPLYFTEMNGNFSFSSELKALFKLPWINKEIDNKVLYDFLTYNTVATPHTMFKGISKFKPGHYMVVTKEGIKAYESFNDLKHRDLNFSSEKELEDLVYSKLEESVKL